jgi:hypothetical protein
VVKMTSVTELILIAIYLLVQSVLVVVNSFTGPLIGIYGLHFEPSDNIYFILKM